MEAKIKARIEELKKILEGKQKYAGQLRHTLEQTSTDIIGLNGAIQELELMIKQETATEPNNHVTRPNHPANR